MRLKFGIKFETLAGTNKCLFQDGSMRSSFMNGDKQLCLCDHCIPSKIGLTRLYDLFI